MFCCLAEKLSISFDQNRAHPALGEDEGKDGLRAQLSHSLHSMLDGFHDFRLCLDELCKHESTLFQRSYRFQYVQYVDAIYRPGVVRGWSFTGEVIAAWRLNGRGTKDNGRVQGSEATARGARAVSCKKKFRREPTSGRGRLECRESKRTGEGKEGRRGGKIAQQQKSPRSRRSQRESAKTVALNPIRP